jgi:hypothetical protein
MLRSFFDQEIKSKPEGCAADYKGGLAGHARTTDAQKAA